MKAETTGEAAKDGTGSSVSPSAPAAQADQPARGDWAVTVSPDAPAKQTEKPARGDWAVAVTPEPPAAHKPLVKHTPAVIHKRPAAAHPPSDGHAPAAEAHPSGNRAEKLDKVFAPPPSRGKLARIMVGLAIVLVVGVAVAAHLSTRRAEEQRTEKALATVTGFISRLEELKKQAAPYQQQLDGPIADLQSILAASVPNKDFPHRIDGAITSVAKVESAVFGVETEEEPAKQALEALARHPDYQALSGKMSAAVADYQGRQKTVEAKCQKVRSLIISARQQAQRLNGAAK